MPDSRDLKVNNIQWGYNDAFQLGDGSNTNRPTPVRVGSDSNWIRMAIGGSHSVGIKSDGTLWGWGRNGYGALGKSYVLEPEQITAF